MVPGETGTGKHQIPVEEEEEEEEEEKRARRSIVGPCLRITEMFNLRPYHLHCSFPNMGRTW
jgi:hypothetical protein